MFLSEGFAASLCASPQGCLLLKGRWLAGAGTLLRGCLDSSQKSFECSRWNPPEPFLHCPVTQTGFGCQDL